MTKPLKRKASNLEREVINAVMILYALISIAMLAIHYLQPAGQETGTSSTSPSHESLRSSQVSAATPAKS
jgi:hypothetical protein